MYGSAHRDTPTCIQNDRARVSAGRPCNRRACQEVDDSERMHAAKRTTKDIGRDQ